MKTKNLIYLPLTLSLFCAGCVGTGPNTQQGAVTGGVLGAIAGGIIGSSTALLMVSLWQAWERRRSHGVIVG